MKKTPKILPTYYKSLGTKIFRDTTALPFADGGPLNDRNIKGDLLPSVYASALGRYYSNGGKFLTAGGEYHRIYKNPEGDIMVNHPKEDKGKWDTINLTEKSDANTISEGVDATKQWHADNPNVYANGGMIKRADGSYSKRGLWDNIRANAGSGKEPTKDMLAQERKINNNYAEGGQLKPDYSLPEDSFQQGGRGLKNSVYASSMGQYPANYAQGGAMNQYPDGGAIYTYAKRPGSYYQKDNNGQWYISNKGTGGQYVPVEDPSGQRTAALNKGATVIMSNPTAPKKDYSKVTPSYNKSGMVQSVVGRTEAERQPVENDIYAQNFMSQMRQDTAESQKNAFPQHEQPLDMMNYAWQAAAGLPTGLKAVGQLAALQIPYTGVSLGTAAQTAGVIHGTTQIPDRAEDWKNVYEGKMDYRDALLNTALTAGEFLGTKSAYDDIANATKRLSAPLKTAGTGKTLITAGAPKTVVGTLDDFDETIGASVPIGSNKNTAVDISGKPHAIDLAAWEKAKGNAEVNDWRFIIPEQEEQFLASKYAQEFADKYNVPIESLNSYDVALYGKLQEAENLPVRQVGSASEKLFGKEKELHNSFMEQQKPKLDLNTNEELVVDAYTRGYDSKINSRGAVQGANFYKDELATPLEEIILKNKLQQPTTLVRGSKDFDIADTSSVLRNGEPISNLKFSQLQEGDVFAPNAFTSTRISDIDPNAPQIPLSNFTLQSGNLDYIINAPVGQSYLYPNASNIHNYVGELEAVLPKNLQFKLDKVVSDVDRGYLPSASDVKPGVRYGVGNLGFTRVQNKYLPFVKALDKIEQSKWDQATKDYITTSQRLSKNAYQRLIDSHNQTHQPTIPKYHFSILNPYRLGGKLNKNYYF